MVSMEEDNHESPTKLNKYATACALIASMISIIFGYDTGVMSGALPLIQEDLQINDTKQEMAAGVLNLCALVGSLLAGRTSDYMGRRYTIVLAASLFFIGSIVMGYSPSYAVLMTGRCIAGVGVGFALMIAPVYSAEISAASSRGLLSSLPELGIAIGILFGYLSNYTLAKLPLHLSWRIMLGIAAIPSSVLAFVVLKMPESPRWLIMQGRIGDAKRILQLVSNTKEEAENRLRDIKAAAGIDNSVEDEIVKVEKQSHGEGVLKELIFHPTPTVRWMLIAAIGIHFFEHATGIEAVILYSPKIFKKAGVHNKSKLRLVTVGVGVTKAACVLIATMILDKIGRRKLVLISVTGMIAALACLGSFLTFINNRAESPLWALVCSIASTYSYVAFFNIGLAPVTWVYSSEIFPSRLRAQGHSIGVAVNRLMNAAVSMSFLSIVNAITIGGAFFMFCGMSVLALIFFYFFLPETKGKTLEEMEDVFSRKKKMKNRAEVDLKNMGDV
ncbi:probable polyol transporter 6 [Impatiens glandulifera]|uniref:probable polyol transporter 6 n=1 Tax=Impatiens glandulifera TaxID=253017 RepID=UPI001FB0F8AB|nr:probable polyol transporter 6 [Impatiens glandulifera]